jgi:branched-chain amino acid transport system ATP-binding protein
MMFAHIQEPPPPIRSLRPDLPPAVEIVIQKALAKDRELRFQSAGEMAAVVGPDGAGKTTLFNLITGVLPLSKGSIQFEGKELNKLRPHEISRLGIARTFQNIRLFPSMTVLENVLVAQNIHTQSGVGSIFKVRGSDPKLLDQAAELLKQMGLWTKRKEISTSLAYGEQRRLEIARRWPSDPSSYF